MRLTIFLMIVILNFWASLIKATESAMKEEPLLRQYAYKPTLSDAPVANPANPIEIKATNSPDNANNHTTKNLKSPSYNKFFQSRAHNASYHVAIVESNVPTMENVLDKNLDRMTD